MDVLGNSAALDLSDANYMKIVTTRDRLAMDDDETLSSGRTLTKLSIGLLLTALSVLFLGEVHADATLDQKTALHELANAAREKDYSKFPHFFHTLGLTYSNFRSYELKEQGVEAPKALGTKQEADLTSGSKSTLSKAIRTIEFGSITPLGKKRADMHIFLGLDPKKLCIQKGHFMDTFAPLHTVYATDLGPSHLERVFTGPNHRGIGAFFDDKGCVVNVFFMQDPYH